MLNVLSDILIRIDSGDLSGLGAGTIRFICRLTRSTTTFFCLVGSYGITGWSQSYLVGRNQFVRQLLCPNADYVWRTTGVGHWTDPVVDCC